MATLSVIIITKNEEHNIDRALQSVKFADEIVIYDSFSVDRTVEIAQMHGCRIIQKEFTGFGAAKQAALDAATCEWVLSIDADEQVDSQLQAEIIRAINDGNCDGYYVNRLSRFLNKWIRYSGWYPDYLLRLFKRGSARFSDNTVHESVVFRGDTARLNGHLLHYTANDLSTYLTKLNHYSSLSAKMMFDRGRRFCIFDLLVRPSASFLRAYILKLGFLDGAHGLLLAGLAAHQSFLKYAKLWDLQRQQHPSRTST